MNFRVGFSTGCLYQDVPNIKDALRVIRNLGCNAVELNFIKAKDLTLETVKTLDPDDFEGFDYVSLHAPSSGVVYEMSKPTDEIFLKIHLVNDIRKLDNVVFHPDTLVHPDILLRLGINYSLENMDKRKKDRRYPQELLPLMLCLSNAGFVFDINHALSIDRVNLWMRYINENAGSTFGERLRHVHLSGYQGYHDPLFKTGQRNLVEEVAKLSHVPIIIESVVGLNEIEREFQYVLDVLAEK
ncbi:MAG: hypothetical protein COV29_01855 [Candidatus Yanofskybacteria bacterium CG10_big_fil_rev_8_21_14_0_10_36_16]|uniref:Xylose isomerase-like TIM barrel domain-containing protein n=1 Tax=Candidatus Yanofskybacteria bacterium CG10_big_fil_rev_8_21_14_0_10_36_16 TaxID=1975096 RepID=A0A2J0Q7F1_9BACT|nr:MAG: hypothetical protein COV29_01855 [Candidatus Yanofskybacteria bacterium CG10_big_fil_rev_8_21_14_0_10_36_16]